MYYRLNDNLAFRGWMGLPYAVASISGTVEPFFCDRKTFDILLKCDGNTEIEADSLDEKTGSLLDRFSESGFLESSREPLGRLRPQQEYRLYETAYMESFLWSVTGKCNCKCRHCLLSVPDIRQEELSLDECRHIIRELKTGGVTKIDLSGGEPLVRKDFWQITDELSKAGIRIRTIFTNGRLIDRRFIEELDKRQLYPGFQISFDGVGYHDWLRGVPGAEEETIRAIELLTSNNRRVSCSMCIHKKNKDTLRETANLMAELGVNSFGVNAPDRMGCWAEYSEKYALSDEEEIEAFKTYIPKYFEDKAPVDIDLDGYFRGVKEQKFYTIPRFFKFRSKETLSGSYICKTARFKSYISSDGRIMPCMGFSSWESEDNFPSILEKSLAEITADSFYRDIVCTTKKEFLKKNTECNDCSHLLKCGGGCSACALNDTGDPCGIDKKQCRFFRKGFADEIRKVIPDDVTER